MKILKLTAENIKKLSAVEITPDGNVVLITGKNGAGKSSVLDSIEMALCGGKMPKKPIKDGEVRARIMTELGDGTPEYRVTRKFFGANSTLTVESIGENTVAEVRSPQAFLNRIVGNISFDPLAFLNKQPTEQRNTLMEFLGLNLEEFANKIETLKVQRSEVRKEKERKLHEAESITTTPNLPPQEVSSESLLVELKAIQDYNEKCQEVATENAVRFSKLETVDKEIAAGEKALNDWGLRLQALAKQKLQIGRGINVDIPTKDSAEVEAKLNSLSATNEAIRWNKQKEQAVMQYDGCVSMYSKLGDDIKMVENQKAKKLAGAVMPVVGLTILPDGLGYNGLPLEQECDSKRLKICVAIAMAMNPKLKVLRIDGNGLDKDSLVAIGELVTGKDYQVWIEKVSDDKKIGFYIEDGHLAGEQNEKETS